MPRVVFSSEKCPPFACASPSPLVQLPGCQGLGESRLVLAGAMTFSTNCLVRRMHKTLCCACWDAKFAANIG